MTVAVESNRVDRAHVRFDLAVLTVVTVLLRLPAFVAERHLTFDDGVFGASAVAMRAGGQPFRDVFSSQGPLFLPLLWTADLLGFRRADSPRLLAVAAGVVLVVAVYLAGRAVADRPGALLAAGLTSACASILWVTGPLAADGVALAFATVTMLLLLRWRDDITIRRALWLGLGIGATISVKALLAPIIVPVAVVLVVGRRLTPIVAGAATALVFHFLLWLPWGPSAVWDQAYAYHLDVAGDRTPGANLAKVFSTLGDRDLPLVAALVLAVAALALARRGRRLRPPWPGALTSPDGLILLWLASTVLVLLTEHPMWRPHVSQLVPPLALLVALHRPPTRALAAAAVVVVPYHVAHAWPVLHPTPYRDGSAEVHALLEALPPGALAVSDDPGIVWRAGRRTTDDLVDTSVLRIETGRMSSDSVMKAATSPGVCAVSVRSSERWGSFTDLPRQLLAAGYHVALVDGRDRRLYVKDPCDPG
jgi:4-amino-4-deoxy-L-arabinose transferase-like glycosyltransferase